MDLNYFKNKFNWKEYVNKYEDLSHADNFNKAWNHAKNYGYKEGRDIFNGDKKLLQDFQGFRATGKIIRVTDKYNNLTNCDSVFKEFLKSDGPTRAIRLLSHVNDGKLIDSYDRILQEIKIKFTTISVICPFYNESIDSIKDKINNFILESKNLDIKLILINDNVNRNDVGELLGIVDGDEVGYVVGNVHIINMKNNHERIHCRNYGAKICNSEYIIFNDIDDIVPKKSYHNLYNYIKNNNLDVCYGNCLVEKKEATDEWNAPAKIEYPSKDFFHICTMIISTELFNKIKFVDYFGRNIHNRIYAGEDVNFMFRLLAHKKILYNCNNYTYIYSFGVGSSHKDRTLSRLELFKNILMTKIHITNEILTYFLNMYLQENKYGTHYATNDFLSMIKIENNSISIKKEYTNCEIDDLNIFHFINEENKFNCIRNMYDVSNSVCEIKNMKLIFYERKRLEGWQHYSGWSYIVDNIYKKTQCTNTNNNYSDLYLVDYIEKIFAKKHTDNNDNGKIRYNNKEFNIVGSKKLLNNQVYVKINIFYIYDKINKKWTEIEMNLNEFEKLSIYINNINQRYKDKNNFIKKDIFLSWNNELKEFIKCNKELEKSLLYDFDLLPAQNNYTHDLYNKNFVCFWHNPFDNIPSHFQNGMQINDILEHKDYDRIMDNCKGIITFTDEFKNKLKSKINRDIPIFKINHPHSYTPIHFCFEKFKKNPNKKIAMVGFWLRKIDNFKNLNIPEYEKVYIGNSLNESFKNSNVKCLNRLSNYEYDIFLSQNIVFLDLFDSVVNNTFIECLYRKTPVCLPFKKCFIEILGEGYPLYFKTIQDLTKKITYENIEKTHNYLKTINYDFTLQHFNKTLNDISKKILLKDTLVVVGNGPSVKKEYFDIFKKVGVDTICMNSCYKKFTELNYYPKYFCCFDEKLVESHLSKFKDLVENSPIEKFFFLNKMINGDKAFDEDYLNKNKKIQKINYIESDWDKYSKSTFDTFYNLHNTGSNAINCGIIMGYKRFILIGCDNNYKNLSNVKLINKDNHLLEYKQSEEKNVNYWFDNYQEDGEKFSIPNNEKYHTQGWKKVYAAQFYENIDVINCSSISKLNLFQNSTIEQIFL